MLLLNELGLKVQNCCSNSLFFSFKNRLFSSNSTYSYTSLFMVFCKFFLLTFFFSISFCELSFTISINLRSLSFLGENMLDLLFSLSFKSYFSNISFDTFVNCVKFCLLRFSFIYCMRSC